MYTLVSNIHVEIYILHFQLLMRADASTLIWRFLHNFPLSITSTPAIPDGGTALVSAHI